MSQRSDTAIIAEFALEEYSRSGQLPSTDRIAESTDLDVTTIREIAPDPIRLRAACHRYLVKEAEHTASRVPDWDRFTLQERLGTFVFILLDVLERHARFVDDTFPSVLTGGLNPFEGAIRTSLKTVLDAADVPAVNRILVDSLPTRTVAANGIVWLVRAWIDDDSDDNQRSTALIDRSISFMASSMTDPVPQKGLDLLRYGVEAGYVPFVGGRSRAGDDPGDDPEDDPDKADEAGSE